jgi:hypothetical protein
VDLTSAVIQPVFNLVDTESVMCLFAQALTVVMQRERTSKQIGTVVHPVVMVLKTHPQSLNAQEHGLEALAFALHGTANTTNRFLAVTMGVCDLVVQTMERFSREHADTPTDIRTLMFHSVCALHDLANDDSHLSVVLQAGALQAVIRALRVYADDGELAARCLLALSRFCEGSDDALVDEVGQFISKRSTSISFSGDRPTGLAVQRSMSNNTLSQLLNDAGSAAERVNTIQPPDAGWTATSKSITTCLIAN